MSTKANESNEPHAIERSPEERATHVERLLELTRLPTAAGREGRVERYVRAWCDDRPALELSVDGSGNMHIAPKGGVAGSPLVIEAHMDHPAFVVERELGPATLQVAFRGGVMDDYFPDERVEFYAAGDETGSDPIAGVIKGPIEGEDKVAKRFEVELDEASDALRPGDIGRWAFDAPEIDGDGVLWTHACDNLASVAAAMSAMDALLHRMRAA